jgi:hypothetical protein
MFANVFVSLLQERLFEFDSLHFGFLYDIQPAAHLEVDFQGLGPWHLPLSTI